MSQSTITLGMIQGWYLFLYDYQYRFRLSFLGSFWFAIKPLLTALPLLFVGKSFGFVDDSYSLPFEVYALSGFLMWILFWESVISPMTLVRRARRVLSATRLEPSAILFATVIQTVLSFAILAIVVAITMIWTKTPVAISSILFIAILPILVIAGLSLGLPFAAFSCVYQDFNYGVGYLGAVLIWSAPILHLAPKDTLLWQINSYNPLTYLIESGRQFLFFNSSVAWPTLSIATSIVLVFFTFSFLTYKKAMPTALDYVV